jgi:hypothetical protein
VAVDQRKKGTLAASQLLGVLKEKINKLCPCDSTGALLFVRFNQLKLLTNHAPMILVDYIIFAYWPRQSFQTM